MQDTIPIKDRIINVIKFRGPILPVHAARETGQSMLFASAFLSELFSEKKIKMSYMRVGSSPLYFLPGQEDQLEKYSQHLKSKEKEAFNLLKEKRFLTDYEQNPAIRVALRSIRDFAIPFKHNEELHWRYFTVPSEEFNPAIPDIQVKKEELETKKEKELEIFNKQETPAKLIKPTKIILKQKRHAKKKAPNVSQKKNEKFFEKVKEYLNKNSIELVGIGGFSRNDLILKIKQKGQEKLLIAYNKKNISEKDILNAHKKASEQNLPYIIFSLGELPKKISNIIEAIKDLSSIEKIE